MTLIVALSVLLVPLALLLNAFLATKSDLSLTAANLNTLTIPVSMALTLLTSIFLAEGAFGQFGISRLSTSLVYTAGVILLSVLGWTAVVNLVAITVFAPLSSIILSWYWIKRRRTFHWKWDAGQAKSIAKYGFTINMSGLPYQLNLRLDQAAMAIWLPAETLGFYAVAVAWASTQSFVGTAVSGILLSKSSNVEVSDPTSVDTVIAQFRMATMLLLLLGAAVTVVTPLGVHLLFGPEYVAAIIPAAILCAAGTVANIKLVLHEVARGLGEPSVGVWAESLGLVVTGIMLVALLPTWGMVGAAWTSLVSYLVATIVLLFMTSQRTGIPVQNFFVINRTDVQQIHGVLRRVCSKVVLAVDSMRHSTFSKG